MATGPLAPADKLKDRTAGPHGDYFVEAAKPYGLFACGRRPATALPMLAARPKSRHEDAMKSTRLRPERVRATGATGTHAVDR